MTTSSAPGSGGDHPPVLPLLVLLTDYGTDDWYVGVVKGVIKSICPQAEILDLCHQVPPHSVAHGTLMLSAAYRYFPPGTIFVAVVDPGVGTTREPVLVHAEERWFVAPNNGLLNFLLAACPEPECGAPPAAGPSLSCRVLSNTAYHLPSPSDTFHGRDIFAPCAAQLAAGVPWTLLAPRETSLYGLPTTTAAADRGVIEGNIIHFDHFGNALTNIPRELLDEILGESDTPRLSPGQLNSEGLIVETAGHTISGILRTFASAPPAQPVAYWGSTGHLEIAVNRGNARESLGLHLLDKVTVRAPESGA